MFQWNKHFFQVKPSHVIKLTNCTEGLSVNMICWCFHMKSFLCIHSLLDINLIICFLMFVSPLKPWWLVFTSALLCFCLSSFSHLPMASSFLFFPQIILLSLWSILWSCHVSYFPPKFSATTNSNTKSNFIQRNSFKDSQKHTGIAKYCLYMENGGFLLTLLFRS